MGDASIKGNKVLILLLLLVSAAGFTSLTARGKISWRTSRFRAKAVTAQQSDRPAQLEAVDIIRTSLFQSSGQSRATVKMPGGSGKTIVGLRAVEMALLLRNESADRESKPVLVIVPRLAILEQTIETYMHLSPNLVDDWSQDILCVCSKLGLESIPRTTDETLVTDFLRRSRNRSAIIFSTYYSLKTVEAAMGLLGDDTTSFALAVFDEAHHAAGQGKNSAKALDDSCIRCERRLFLTATPRLFRKDAKKTMRSMDDKELFGHHLFSLGKEEAEEQKITVPVKVIIFALAPNIDPEASDKLLLTNSVHDRDIALRAITIRDAMLRYGLHKVISFSRTNKRAGNLKDSVEMLGSIECLKVNGKMKSVERRTALKQFQVPFDGIPKVIFNSKLLIEGVDLPSCDGVFFSDRMVSPVVIQQAIARAARSSPGKTKGYAIIPVSEDSMLSVGSEAFITVKQVLFGVLSQDEELMKDFRSWSFVQRVPERLIERVFERIELPNGVRMASLLPLIETVIMDISKFTKWIQNFSLLRRFREENGHCLVPAEYEVEGVKLGYWVLRQRKDYKSDLLSEDRIKQLEEIGFVWDPLNSAWEQKVSLLRHFRNEKGHCLVPAEYEVEGVRLGQWVSDQRKDYKNKLMSEDRIKQLKEIGFVWDPLYSAWEQNVSLLRRFREEKGHCLVPTEYEVEGVQLGNWVSVQRSNYKNDLLSEDRIKHLEEIGFVWDYSISAWEQNVLLLRRFREEKGHCLVPAEYEVEGVRLGLWVLRQRKYYKNYLLSEDRIKQLKEIGFVWDPLYSAWEQNVSLLRRFREEKGHCLVPTEYEVEGVQLGNWVSVQRKYYKNDLLSEDRINQLEEIGFVWDALTSAWEQNVSLLRRFREENDHCLVPSDYKVEGVRLGRWVSRQRIDYKNDLLSEDRFKQLEDIGFVWDPLNSAWEQYLSLLRRFYDEKGHCLVPDAYEVEGVRLGLWVLRQRKDYKNDLLSEDRIKQLEEIGFVWDPLYSAWQQNLSLLRRFRDENGYCSVPQSYEAEGVRLGLWVSRQRQEYKKDLLSKDRIKQLEEIGFVWDRRASRIEVDSATGDC